MSDEEDFRTIHDQQTIIEAPGPPLQLPSDPAETMHPPVPFKDDTAELGTAKSTRLRTMKLDSTFAGPAPDEPGAEAAAFLMNRIVGTGGFGDVWEAVQVSLERRVAVKRIRASLYSQKLRHELQTMELHFQREAMITGQLDHPNIVPVYDLGTDEDGHPLLAMKFIDGQPWSRLIYEERSLSCPQRLSKHLPVLISVAQAIAFAHSRGIIHRDVKPGQVMIGRFGQVYLMDWGLAVAFNAGDANNNFAVPLHDAPNPAGTVSFMAPEQTDKTPQRLGPWTDVFLLGGALYLLLTLTPPHRQDASSDAWDEAVRGMVEPPEKRAPDQEIPGQLSRLCQQAMATAIGQRITALEFIKGLENYLMGKSRIEESITLVAQTREMLKTADGSYEDFSRCEMTLRRAMALWPDNPEGEMLEQQLIRDFIETSLARGDLGLARFQIARVNELTERTEFNRRLKSIETKNHSRELQRRVLFSTLMMLLIGIPTVFSVNLWLKLREDAGRRKPGLPANFVPISVHPPDTHLYKEE